MATLAGIGVSWYTALESGDADGVSEATVLAVSDALRLSESERHYLLTLTGRADVPEVIDVPSALLTATVQALTFPAYIITASWDVVVCNEAFRRVWNVDARELPFNAVERLFLEPSARAMHGNHFKRNIAPVVAMLRSAIGRRPHHETLRRVRDMLVADEALKDLWDAYEVSDPLMPNGCTIESAVGTFSYEALTLANPGDTLGLVVQVPDRTSRALLSAPLPSPERQARET